jgi:hypothetical protein
MLVQQTHKPAAITCFCRLLAKSMTAGGSAVLQPISLHEYSDHYARRLLAGEYNWIIFGDDDTVFFPGGIIRALETHHLDADSPYFVSGVLITYPLSFQLTL